MAKGDYEPGKVGGDYEKGINRGEGPAPAPKGGERDAGLSTEPIDFADDAGSPFRVAVSIGGTLLAASGFY